MRYCEHQPSPRLACYLECIWFLTNDSSTPGTTPERVFPDGCIEWIFHLGQRFRLWHAAQWELQPISFVVGELTRFLLLQPSGSVATMGVRFRPGGAYRFLPCPVNVITNKLISTGDIWGGAGEALERQVLTANGDRERISQIEAFLLERLAGIEARPRFDLAVKEILRHRGQNAWTIWQLKWAAVHASSNVSFSSAPVFHRKRWPVSFAFRICCGWSAKGLCASGPVSRWK